MSLDDDLPRPRPEKLAKPLLDPFGVEELTAYIGELEAEIVRVRAEIARKQSHRSAADSFFKKP